jgi:hypothetical protein
VFSLSLRRGTNRSIWRNRDGLPICVNSRDVREGSMNPRRIVNWLIALTVAAGLVAAPLSVPAMAALQPVAAVDGMQAMADDMPCCPDQQDRKAKDCGSCPFVALCMLTMTVTAPDGAGALVARNFCRSAFALPDDLLIDGLGEHPPDHPPRTIV